MVSVQHFLHSSARWIQTCPACSEVIYNLAGSCKNNCLNKCGLGRQYWNIRSKRGKQNYTHTALTSSLARPGKQLCSLSILLSLRHYHSFQPCMLFKKTCWTLTLLSLLFFWNSLQRQIFLFQFKLQKDGFLTQQAEGTTLKTTSHSWMTSAGSYIICLCSVPGKTSVSFMPIFVSFTNLNSSSHSNSLHKICIYTRQSIIQPSFTKNLHFPKK